jgi:hypothetical protein
MKTWNRFRPRVEELEQRLAPATLSYSTNWSGYAVSTSAGAVSQVAGNWVVPAVSSNVSGYSSAWVGIDGWSSNSVEQIGTDSDYVNGQAHYYAWYEMYPANSVNLSLTINPHDTISASVSYASPNQFALSITDVTTGKSFSTTQTSSRAQRSSAEWIQEAPSGGGVLPLASFGTINLSGATATINGTTGPADNPWSGSTLYQTNMATKSGALEATTSALSDSGSPPTSSFSVTWVSSGSGGGGGKNKSSNVPPTDDSPTLSLLSAVAAIPQTAPPAFVATQSRSMPVKALVVVAPFTVPALGVGTATFARFVSETSNPDRELSGPANSPELPLPRAAALPVDSGSAAHIDGLPTPQADEAPPSSPEASPEMGGASDATLVDGCWMSMASLEGAFNTGHEEQDIPFAALVLFFALDHTWASAWLGQTGTRDGIRSRSRPKGG